MCLTLVLARRACKKWHVHYSIIASIIACPRLIQTPLDHEFRAVQILSAWDVFRMNLFFKVFHCVLSSFTMQPGPNVTYIANGIYPKFLLSYFTSEIFLIFKPNSSEDYNYIIELVKVLQSAVWSLSESSDTLKEHCLYYICTLFRELLCWESSPQSSTTYELNAWMQRKRRTVSTWYEELHPHLQPEGHWYCSHQFSVGISF